MINGRLKFRSEADFQDFYYKNQDKDEDVLFEMLEEFYSKGFLSLRPPMSDKNIDEIERQLTLRYSHLNLISRQNQRTTIDDDYFTNAIDELEELIACDVFSAFLNDGGEIMIGDKIYKYSDVGLFKVDEDKYDSLITFLNENSISINPLIRTLDDFRSTFLVNYQMPSETPIMLNNNLQYFRISRQPNALSEYIQESDFTNNLLGNNPVIGGGLGGSNNNNGGNNVYKPLENLKPFIDNLQPCNSNSGFLGSVFGDNVICFDQFASNRRIRTKAWRHNYLLVYTLGTKVKNQKRQCVIICWWYKTNDGASEIVKADEAVQFEYSFTHIFSPHQINQAVASTNQNQVYYNRFNVQYEVLSNIYSVPNGTSQYTFVNSFTYPISNNIPILRDDLVIEAFGNNNTVDNAFNALNNQLAANNLNKEFWRGVWNSAKNQLSSLTNNNQHTMPNKITFVSTHPSFGKVFIQKSDFQYKLNSSNISRTFDWGISLSIDISQTGKIKPGAGNHVLYPQNVRFKVVGAAKVHGTWRGSKIIHNF